MTPAHRFAGVTDFHKFCRLSDIDMQSILQYIREVQHLHPESEKELLSKLQPEERKKGEYLSRQDQICHRLYFLEKGCLRGYYLKAGREITHWFGFENDFVTSFYSFITRRPAVENIQLLEDSVLYSISKTDLELLCDRYADLARLLRLSYEKYYIRLEEKYINHQFKTATERYEELIATRPHFIQRIPLRHIASFLGISNETLSRIRTKNY